MLYYIFIQAIFTISFLVLDYIYVLFAHVYKAKLIIECISIVVFIMMGFVQGYVKGYFSLPNRFTNTVFFLSGILFFCGLFVIKKVR